MRLRLDVVLDDVRRRWPNRIGIWTLLGGVVGAGAGCGTADHHGAASSSGGTHGSATPNAGAPSGGGAAGASAAGTTGAGGLSAGGLGGTGSPGGSNSASGGRVAASGRAGAGGIGDDRGGRSNGAGGAALGGSGAGAAMDSGGRAGAGNAGGTPGSIRYVFVVAMENHDQDEIVGNEQAAPFINDTLLPAYASTSNFVDEFALSTPSEPHYIWMEAGTNAFADHTFTNDDVPSASNSTANTDHLVTQIANATHGVTWHSYQQGLSTSTGACPIAASGHYVPRHDPFVFFGDVTGSPPATTNSYCAEHHSAIEALAADLTNGTVATYDFVTPDLCNDMHGQSGCPDQNAVHAGDAWLEANLPDLVTFVNEHSGVVFIVWDEGDSTTKMPFIAVGPGVKSGYTGNVKYTHGSLLKSLEEILGLPVLPKVASENDFSDLFLPGRFP